MGATKLSVFTVESDPRCYSFAQARLWRCRNVRLLLGDSRAGLRAIFAGSLRHVTMRPLFVYLDAHWNEDLPLAEELKIVFGACQLAIVMVDDFEVPLDAGYGFDDYGPGKALTSAYIAPIIASQGLRAFYPSTPSAKDTGMRRGCFVLAKDSIHIPTLSSLSLLTSITNGGQS